jgi:hypothetical protein
MEKNRELMSGLDNSLRVLCVEGGFIKYFIT